MLLKELNVLHFFSTDVNECADNCANSHDCVNIPGGFYCTCNPGYTLLSSGTCSGIIGIHLVRYNYNMPLLRYGRRTHLFSDDMDLPD